MQTIFKGVEKFFDESEYGSRKRNSAGPNTGVGTVHICYCTETLSYIELCGAEMDGEPQIAEHPYEDGGPPPHVESGR